MHIYIYIYIHEYIHVYMHVCTRMYIYIYIYIYIIFNLKFSQHAHVLIYTYFHRYYNARMYMYKHKYTQPYIFIASLHRYPCTIQTRTHTTHTSERGPSQLHIICLHFHLLQLRRLHTAPITPRPIAIFRLWISSSGFTAEILVMKANLESLETIRMA
jgi:hypothetical protein